MEHVQENETQLFSQRGVKPVAASEAMAFASGDGLGSCVGQDFDERCSTHHRSTPPCSPRPSEALKHRSKTTESMSKLSQSRNIIDVRTDENFLNGVATLPFKAILTED